MGYITIIFHFQLQDYDLGIKVSEYFNWFVFSHILERITRL